MKFTSQIVTTLLLAAASVLPLSAGNLLVTGHDDDYHAVIANSREALAQLQGIVTFARKGAPNPALKVLIFDHTRVPSTRPLLARALDLASVSYDLVDPNTGVPDSSLFDATKYSAIGVASDQTCGGCDNDVTSSTNLAAAKTSFIAFVNAGGGVFALAAGSNANYYSFLPATASAIGRPQPFQYSQTPAGLANGVPPDNGGDETHNLFANPGTGGVDPKWLVFETYTGSDEISPSTYSNQPVTLGIPGATASACGFTSLRLSPSSLGTSPLVQGLRFTTTLTASGGSAPYIWAVTAVPGGPALPADFQLVPSPDTQTAVVSFTPTAGTGSVAFRVSVSDPSSRACPFTQDYSNSTTAGRTTTTITTSCPLPNGINGVRYEPIQFAQTGFATAPAWRISSGALPTGIDFSSLGVAVGTPTTSGTFFFTVQAVGIAIAVPTTTGSEIVTVPATATEACSVTITDPVAPPPPPPPPLSINTTCPLPPATVGSIYQAGLSASGGSGALSFTIGGGLPPGLILDNNTVRGVPGTAGTYNFTLQVGNQSQACSVVVKPNPLVLSGCPLPDGTVGAGYSAAFSVQGGAPPYSYFAAGLPPGLSVANGSITGTPSAAGTFAVSLRGSDATGINTSQSCPVTITQPPALKITSTSPLPAGTAGVNYSATLVATGGVGPLTWSGTGFPANVSLSANGTIAGIPASSGTYNITATVTDSLGVTDRGQFTLVIGNAPPVITTSCPLPTGRAGVAYSAPLSANAGTPPYRWDLSAGSLPGALSVNPAGSIGGTPSSAGQSNFTLRVTDSNSATATQACSLSILSPLTITSANPGSFTAGGLDATLKNGFATLTVTGTGFGPDTTVLWNGTAVTSTVNDGTSLSAQIPASLIFQPGTANLTVTSSIDRAVSNTFAVRITLPPVPALTLLDLSDPIAPAQQPVLGVQLEGLSSGSSTYPFDITGTVTLAVTSDPAGGSVDPLVKFLNDGFSSSFTLKAGTSQVQFPPLMSTGTVASTLTFTVSNLSTAGQPISTPPASKTTHVARLAPVIQTACYATTSTGFSLSVTGYSTTRSLTQMGVSVTATPDAGLQSSTLPAIDLTAASTAYFSAPASVVNGGLFTLSLPLNVQGNAAQVTGFAVTLSNSVGTSTSQPASKCP